jgi:hypothetical protein
MYRKSEFDGMTNREVVIAILNKVAEDDDAAEWLEEMSVEDFARFALCAATFADLATRVHRRRRKNVIKAAANN